MPKGSTRKRSGMNRTWSCEAPTTAWGRLPRRQWNWRRDMPKRHVLTCAGFGGYCVPDCYARHCCWQDASQACMLWLLRCFRLCTRSVPPFTRHGRMECGTTLLHRPNPTAFDSSLHSLQSCSQSKDLLSDCHDLANS